MKRDRTPSGSRVKSAKILCFTAAWLGMAMPLTTSHAASVPACAASTPEKEKERMNERNTLMLDPALKKLSECVGTKWVGVLHGEERDLKTEFSAEWAMNRQAIRFRGVIDKDGPIEFETESLYSWDSVNKKPYYVDFHGPDDLYKGTVHLNGDVVEQEFERIVGTPARWKSTLDFHRKDTVVFTLYTQKDGKWAEWKSVEYHRQH